MDLVKERGSDSLEDTFVGYLADAAGIDRTQEGRGAGAGRRREAEPAARPKRFRFGRLWAYARRETLELLRDPIRLAFALLGPIILMVAFGYGISFDIENLQTASFDQDDTPAEPRNCSTASPARAISRCSRRSRPRTRRRGGCEAATLRSSSKCRPDLAAIC